MKKRIILLVLPILLASCSSNKKIETNKEIKEISTQIATSIKGVDECKAYQYEESSLIVSQREAKFSYDKKVKINIPSYEGYENITEKLLKSYGIAV